MLQIFTASYFSYQLSVFLIVDAAITVPESLLLVWRPA